MFGSEGAAPFTCERKASRHALTMLCSGCAADGHEM
jgi:hypothetical protein